ncbi:class C sortase [Corynebacterium riegelii]|uniref:class C sortase n=1 Tax=Corynebacterium riegelii TaxID=156976 RepID=UPI0023F909EA|nr:class C sortase [Corynebacterium riegelii]
MAIRTVERKEPRRSVNGRGRNLLSVLLLITSLLVLSYPVVTTYYQNEKQVKVADAYRNSTVVGRDFTELLEEAHAYNREHAGAPILDPWLARVAKDNRPYQDYLEQLNVTGKIGDPMGVVAIPSIDSKLPVYHGTDQRVLNQGIGHLYGSSLPVGGEGMHSVLTAHTGLAHATLFDNLTKVKIGDRVYLDVAGEQLTYEVDQIDVVLPTEIESLQPVAGADLLTLITCTPYGINSHRLLVRGHRVENDAQAAADAFSAGSSVQWWMYLVAVLIMVIVAAYVVLRRRNAYKGVHRRTRSRAA